MQSLSRQNAVGRDVDRRVSGQWGSGWSWQSAAAAA